MYNDLRERYLNIILLECKQKLSVQNTSARMDVAFYSVSNNTQYNSRIS